MNQRKRISLTCTYRHIATRSEPGNTFVRPDTLGSGINNSFAIFFGGGEGREFGRESSPHSP